jgi:hypothetical protein
MKNTKINLGNIVLKSQKDYMFNTLGIDNFNRSNSALRHYYNHIKKFDKVTKGDIFEFGVFKGRSLLATAILLKKIKISKNKTYPW